MSVSAVRILTKPSTAQCTLDLYVRYLLARPQGAGCSEMADILEEVSHDSINRFLLRERYVPKDLFDLLLAHGALKLVGGVLSSDDTVIEKPYSDPNATELLGYYWSSKAGKPILGIPLITLYYTSANGLRVPINYRLYNKQEGKTKNQYLRDMLQEVEQWGVRARAFTSDAWYASKANLNLVKNAQMGFLVGIAKNRLVRLGEGRYQRVDSLHIPTSGLKVHLKGVTTVKVCCQRFKNDTCRITCCFIPRLSSWRQRVRRTLRNSTRSIGGLNVFIVPASRFVGSNDFGCASVKPFIPMCFVPYGPLLNWSCKCGISKSTIGIQRRELCTKKPPGVSLCKNRF